MKLFHQAQPNKNGRGTNFRAHTVSNISLKRRKSRLKACGFLQFLLSFCSISVFSLTVHLYAYRSSAEDFRSKSVRPDSVSFIIL